MLGVGQILPGAPWVTGDAGLRPPTLAPGRTMGAGGQVSPRGCSPQTPNWFFSPHRHFPPLSARWGTGFFLLGSTHASPAWHTPAEGAGVQSRALWVLPTRAACCPAHPQHPPTPPFHPQALKGWLKLVSTDHPAGTFPTDTSSRGRGGPTGQGVPWVLVQPQGAATNPSWCHGSPPSHCHQDACSAPAPGWE